MTDLISRSAVLTVGNVRKVTEYDEAGYDMAYDAVPVEAIEAIPAIDAVPVVNAEWISEIVTKCDWKGRLKQYFQPCSCSACHEPAIREYNYCPNCGARMDEREDTNGHQTD